MKNKISTLLRNKVINGSRYLYVKYMPGLFDSFLVTEYPKSGGTWLGQLLSGYFNVPFPRNKFPSLKMSVIHGHYLPSNSSKKIKKIFRIYRDGRDVMVSSYYHNLIWNEKNIKTPKDVLYYRKKLCFTDIMDIKVNLPKYIEFIFTHTPSPIVRFGFEGNWASFNNRWNRYYEKGDRHNLINTSYEKLLNDTKKELVRLISEINGEEADLLRVEQIVQRYSFKNQANRVQGVEKKNSFLRKGIAGDWKNNFSKESAEIFNYYAGEMLMELGYEKDKEWVKDVE